jgi:hypothetical protein
MRLLKNFDPFFGANRREWRLIFRINMSSGFSCTGGRIKTFSFSELSKGNFFEECASRSGGNANGSEDEKVAFKMGNRCSDKCYIFSLVDPRNNSSRRKIFLLSFLCVDFG